MYYKYCIQPYKRCRNCFSHILFSKKQLEHHFQKIFQASNKVNFYFKKLEPIDIVSIYSDMAGAGAGTTSALIMGGFLCLGLVLVAIAATVILSLISIYTPNHGQTGYGEGNSVYTKFIQSLLNKIKFLEYRLDAMMLKFLYTNISGNFSGGSIASNTDLSDLVRIHSILLSFK